ncbi:MAG: phosphatase PAP2 family protein [Niastella sp.]|nr:phosphatase PAP2 family protein [Niastella sp.]
MNFWELLEAIDKDVFTFVNVDASAPWLDGFMKFLRNATVWIPLYAFMFYWIIKSGRKYAWQFILLTVATFALNDFISAKMLKPWFERLRPCFDPELQGIVRSLVGCGGQYGFPSSHAANHFGLAMFWFYSIQLINGKRWHWLWLWAFIIGYAQIYVGKHFPLDIIGGAIMGIAIGYLLARIFQLWCFPSKSGSESGFSKLAKG